MVEPDIEEDIEQEPVKEENSRRVFCWHVHETFATFSEAHSSLQQEGFTKNGMKSGATGTKTYYRCGKVTSRSKEQCDAHRFIFESHSTLDSVVYHNNCDHTHDTVNESTNAKNQVSSQ